MRRRQFIRRSSAALAATALLGPSAARALAAARAAGVPDRLGVQLYTVRDVFPDDVVGVLEAIRRMGYEELEFAGYAGREPVAMRAVIDAVGLTAPSTHVPLDALRGDLDRLIETCRTMGHRYLTLPWIAPEMRTSVDDYLRLADELNGIGERTDAGGVRLVYHNHDFEFETFGGERPAYDAFVERLDARLVELELDLYWITLAGHDPVAYFERYPGRFPLWHVKDGSGPELTMSDVGAGRMDWARIFGASETAGLRHAVVEHDEPADSLASVRASIDYLTALRDG
jgi:sugar phosphate isomerase/epimerase